MSAKRPRERTKCHDRASCARNSAFFVFRAPSTDDDLRVTVASYWLVMRVLLVQMNRHDRLDFYVSCIENA